MCEHGFDADGLFTWLVQELDPLMSRWPPVVASDDRELRALVSSAVEGLDAVALLEILEAGPARWRKHEVDACTVAGLAAQLRGIVIKALTAELREVIGRWVAWDVPKLRDQPRQREVIDLRERRRPRPVGKARTEKLTRPYVPPGRT